MATVSAERLAEVFVEVSDTLVSHFDIIEFLQMVTSRTAELIDAAAVGVLLADQHGELQFMAASDEATTLLELFQVQTAEGPCLEAYRTRAPVMIPDVRVAADRWPQFAPRAVKAGFLSVHAVPMHLRDQAIGAMNIFSTHTGGMEPNELVIAQSLADTATIGLMQERAIRRGEMLTEQLHAALNSRIVIEQAKGALSRIHGVSVDEAFGLMREFARDHNYRLGEVATYVITEPARVSGLMRP
ncbi:MAG TPA: GAF and ANTAR domain-containing protein [Actinotalea sp.]|jgi:GAF domain-containing protein